MNVCSHCDEEFDHEPIIPESDKANMPNPASWRRYCSKSCDENAFEAAGLARYE